MKSENEEDNRDGVRKRRQIRKVERATERDNIKKKKSDQISE